MRIRLTLFRIGMKRVNRDCKESERVLRQQHEGLRFSIRFIGLGEKIADGVSLSHITGGVFSHI